MGQTIARVDDYCMRVPRASTFRRSVVRGQPLVQRRAQLEAILKRGASRLIRFSESSPDVNALLVECARRGLEGIVSMRP